MTQQRNKYEDWIAMAKAADYNVIWLQLDDEHAGMHYAI